MMNFTCIGKGHGAPAVPATREAWEQLRKEPWLADMCRRIEHGDEQLKPKLPIWTPHCAEFKNNHRAIADAVKPLQRLMLDFDEKGHSAEILEKALQLQAQGKWVILLVEDSVRRGTHVLVEVPQGMTAEEVQTRFSDDVGFKADSAVKDVARCIYMVPETHTLYVNDALFAPQSNTESHGVFNGHADVNDAPQSNTESHGVFNNPAEEKNNKLCETPCNSVVNHYPQTYNGIPYESIVEVLEEQMGGHPEHGSRNNFIFSMACHLRHVCNDEEAWIAQILPTYGEARSKWLASIKSACSRKQSSRMPRILKRVLDICKQREEEISGANTENAEEDTPPPMPNRLPPLIKLLVSKTPKIYQPAVAHAVFPSLAAHLWKTTFRYIDNVEHEATLMNVLMAGTGAGKNCISEPINHILADIRKMDKENLQREKDWKNEMQTKGSNKDKRKRPEGLIIQEIDPDTTNAAFVMRLAEAEERFLYTKMNEIDQFDALKTSARSKAHFQIMCLAFDPGNVYGQTRVGTGSVSERVCIRFNWNASTTVYKGQAYFRNVLTDGPISRINFCTIPEQPIGADMPVYGTYDAEFDEELRPYIERLTKARGLVECRGAKLLAKKLKEENAEFARLSQSRVYENLSFRANVIAYLKAMVLFIAQGGVWDKVTEDFIRWSLKYDMWCKMHFFGEAIEEVECGGSYRSNKKTGPQNLLDLLPDVFTREEAQQMRIRHGITQSSVSIMLGSWKKRKYIELHGPELPKNEISKQQYAKTDFYLKKQA